MVPAGDVGVGAASSRAGRWALAAAACCCIGAGVARLSGVYSAVDRSEDVRDAVDAAACCTGAGTARLSDLQRLDQCVVAIHTKTNRQDTKVALQH